MSERRRLRAGQVAESVVPEPLRRFRPGDWPVTEDPPPHWEHSVADWRAVRARRLYREAREAWAAAHGFDVRAKYGTKPGHDWWAFLELCATQRTKEGQRWT